MYVSNPATVFIDETKRSERTATVLRLYEMGFNLIPVNGKHPPCIEWKPYQTRRVSPKELRDWARGKFPQQDGNGMWRPALLNFALLTGAIPWSDDNPGIVVLDSDDEEADQIVRDRCPETLMVQRTGSGKWHRAYRRPSVEAMPYIPNRQKTWIDGKQYNIDVRGDGGYILCPGSIHPKTGQLYLEKVPWTLELLQQSPVYDPAWLPCERAGTLNRATSTRVSQQVFETADHDERISAVSISLAERERQANVYLAGVPGTQQGKGADRSCTALAMRLLYGFALPAAKVLEMLVEWGERQDQIDDSGGWYPWTESELARKIQWCLRHEYQGEFGDRLHDGHEIDDSEVDEIVVPFDDASFNVINPKDQLDTAKAFHKSAFGGRTLIHHQGSWYRWNSKHWEAMSEDDIKARLWNWLGDCHYRAETKGISDPVRRYQPSRNVVAAVLDALKAVTNRPSSLEMPCWLDTEMGISEVIAFDNGLLDVEVFLSMGHAELLEHTPAWFSSNCLPHEFDPGVGCPRWLAFLNQVFDEDEERIACLQQWFGYNLVADNRQHKLAMLIGPPRSGKGTTMAILSAMLGKHNIASTSLASLGGRFGLEPLIGKLAALIDEGHLGKFSDTSLVLERLKAISGGSEQTVDRKGLIALPSVPLKVRFTIALNELPRLSDASAALRSRLLILPYFNSYEGREDFGLVDRLLEEIPGITNWALAGLRELRRAGRFQNPRAGEKILRDFVYLSSPIQAFLDECCEIGADKDVRREDLQLAWRVWCDENGHMSGSIADFGRKLRAAVPRINDERRREPTSRIRWYTGVGLSPETLSDIRRRRQGVAG